MNTQEQLREAFAELRTGAQFSALTFGHDEEMLMARAAKNGIIDMPSKHSVEETLARVLRALEAEGVKVFAVVDLSFAKRRRPA